MRLIRGLYNLQPQHKNCVASIGNFDGVHLGHKLVLQNLQNKAEQLNLISTVIMFEPQPREYFLAEKSPARLTRFREKFTALKSLKQIKLAQILLLAFNKKLQNMSAEQFIRKILVDGLAVKYLVVGDDFKFGNNRAGNFTTLQQAGDKYNFTVIKTPTFYYKNYRVSSTNIRAALQTNDLLLAKNLLGRAYRICGRVAHGNKKGRTIGFPTANIHLHRQVTPLTGVFAVVLYLNPNLAPDDCGIKINGIANLGTRPTLNGTTTILEVHLFNFSDDIYGVHVSVDFLSKIRDEQKFSTFELLKQQIKHDVIIANKLFNQDIRE